MLQVALLTFSIFFLFNGGHFYHVDEEIHLLVAHSILDGDWAALDPVQSAQYRGSNAGSYSIQSMGKSGADGKFYAHTGIGQAITVLPLAMIARATVTRLPSSNAPAIERLMVSFFCPILAAIVTALVFGLAVQLGYSRSAAFGAAAAMAFGTFFFAQAKFFMNDMLVTALLVSGIYCVHRVRTRNSQGYLLLAGLAAGWIVVTRSDCFFFAALIPLSWLFGKPESRGKGLIAIAMGSLPSLAVLASWNLIRYGTAFDTGYNFTDPSKQSYVAFSEPFFSGFVAQLLSPQSGLIWFAPIAFVALIGIRKLYRRDRSLAVIAGLSLFLPLTFYAKFTNSAGNVSWGPRFLLPALPFLAIATVPVWQEFFQSGKHRRLIVWTSAMGVLIQLSGVLADHNRGFLRTEARIAEWPPYAYMPFNRVWGQIGLLGQRAPDLWWLAGLSQGSGVERALCILGLVAGLSLCAHAASKVYRPPLRKTTPCSDSALQYPGG